VDQPPDPEGDLPESPRQYLALDMLVGRVSEVDLPVGATIAGRLGVTIVGGLNDAVIAVVHPHDRRGDPWRADLVLLDQQPDPDVPRRPVTTNGLVVEAGYDRKHQVVWTQRTGHREPDPHEVWTADLFRPQDPPQLLTTSDGVPYDPVIGTGYVGWTEDGEQLALTPTTGGPVTYVPGRVVSGTSPSAYGRIIAVVLSRHGKAELRVLRVEA
jgi:hypothetical protein